MPRALLLDPEHSPTTKLIWIARRIAPTAGPTELGRLTGLSRPTIQRALPKAAALIHPTTGPRVKLPTALLAERAVGPQAKLLYGILQGDQTQSGLFTYPSLIGLTGLSRNTSLTTSAPAS